MLGCSVLKSTMKVAFNAAPSRESVLGNLSRGRGGDGHAVLYQDLAELSEAQRRVLRAIAKPLVELGLEKAA